MAVEIPRQQQLASLAMDTSVGLSTTRRCLFGPVNHEENRQFLKEWSSRLDNQCQSRWNFNFKSESPLQGRFVWEEVENSPVSDSPKVGKTPAAVGSYRLKVGMRTIMKKHKLQEQEEREESAACQETDLAEPKGCATPQKPHSITNFEYLPCRLRKALLDFQTEARRVNSSPTNSTESIAVQCDLSSTPVATASFSSSSSSSSSARDGDSVKCADAAKTDAEDDKSATTTTTSNSHSKQECNLKRKQSSILEFFQQKKSRTDGGSSRRVNVAKRRLDL